MRRFGQIIIGLGCLYLTIGIVLFFQGVVDVAVPLLLTSIMIGVIGYGLMKLGQYRKRKAEAKGKEFKEVGYGKLIFRTFLTIFIISIIGRCSREIMLEYDLDYQINVVNRECCPIPIIDGVAEITSIETKNNQIVYNISYDETILSYEKLQKYPNRFFIMSYYILNGQDGGGEELAKMLLQNKYGERINLKSNNGNTFSRSISYEELKVLLAQEKRVLSPAEALNEIIKWDFEILRISLPTKISENMTLVDVFNTNDSLIYKVDVEKEDLFNDIKENSREDLQEFILQELSTNINHRSVLVDCAIGRINLIYRYMNETHTDSCEIVFGHEVINNRLNLPKQLNIK